MFNNIEVIELIQNNIMVDVSGCSDTESTEVLLLWKSITTGLSYINELVGKVKVKSVSQ